MDDDTLDAFKRLFGDTLKQNERDSFREVCRAIEGSGDPGSVTQDEDEQHYYAIWTWELEVVGIPVVVKRTIVTDRHDNGDNYGSVKRSLRTPGWVVRESNATDYLFQRSSLHILKDAVTRGDFQRELAMIKLAVVG